MTPGTHVGAIMAGQQERRSPEFYPGDELHRIKQDRLQRAMEQAGLDALLLIKAEAVRYVTDFYVKGFRPFMEPEYLALVPRGGKPAVGYISGSDDLRIRTKSDIDDVRRLPGLSDWASVVAGMLADYGLQSGRIGTDLLPFSLGEALRRLVPDCQFVDASDLCMDVTVIKHPLEVELIREAVRVADLGMKAAIEAVRPGMREIEVAAEAEYAMRRAGSEFHPFIPVVASGENASMFERIATEKIIRAGEMVILDVGSVVRGYTGDLGRTVATGEPSAAQTSIYNTVRNALETAAAAIRPGVTCGEIDRRAREAIKDSGWEQFQHKGSTGHQLGFGLHGAPLIARGVEVELQENMVICLEPHIVLPDYPEIGGAHLEDVFLVTQDGTERLNDTPYDERLLG